MSLININLMILEKIRNQYAGCQLSQTMFTEILVKIMEIVEDYNTMNGPKKRRITKSAFKEVISSMPLPKGDPFDKVRDYYLEHDYALDPIIDSIVASSKGVYNLNKLSSAKLIRKLSCFKKEK